MSMKIDNLETIFLTIIRNEILERESKTSKVLQSKDVVDHPESMESYQETNLANANVSH